MSSWFDSQVQRLRNMIPFTAPSLLSFIDTVIYNERGDFNRGGIIDAHFGRSVVLTCRYRPDVASRRWYELSWVECDGSRQSVEAQKYDLLLWRATQAHINTVEKQNPKKHAYIDAECTECALAGKSLKPYYKDGHYYGHHCAEHMPKDADTKTTKLFVTIGDVEFEILNFLAVNSRKISDLEKAEYTEQSMGKLLAAEFAYEFTAGDDIPYLGITPKGREFLQKEFNNGTSS